MLVNWRNTLTGCFGWFPRQCTEPRVSGDRVCLRGRCCWQVLRWDYQRWLLTFSLGVSSSSGPAFVCISCGCTTFIMRSYFFTFHVRLTSRSVASVVLFFKKIAGRLTRFLLLCRSPLKKFFMNWEVLHCSALQALWNRRFCICNFHWLYVLLVDPRNVTFVSVCCCSYLQWHNEGTTPSHHPRYHLWTCLAHFGFTLCWNCYVPECLTSPFVCRSPSGNDNASNGRISGGKRSDEAD